jgi:hypothetical protein
VIFPAEPISSSKLEKNRVQKAVVAFSQGPPWFKVMAFWTIIGADPGAVRLR